MKKILCNSLIVTIVICIIFWGSHKIFINSYTYKVSEMSRIASSIAMQMQISHDDISEEYHQVYYNELITLGVINPNIATKINDDIVNVVVTGDVNFRKDVEVIKYAYLLY